MKYPKYGERATDCARFMRVKYPGTIRQTVINGYDMWIWFNIDGHIFAFETEEQAAADICQDMGVTTAELDSNTEKHYDR